MNVKKAKKRKRIRILKKILVILIPLSMVVALLVVLVHFFPVIGAILRVIGFVLLGIFALILLIISVVLLAPVRYKIRGHSPGDIKEVSGRVDFSWIFHLIRGYVYYENKELKWQVHLAWKKMNQEDAKEMSSEEKPEELPTEVVKVEKVVEAESNGAPKPKITKKIEASPKVVAPQKAITRMDYGQAEEDEKQSVFDKVIAKIRAVIEKIQYTYGQICDKINLLVERKDIVMNFLSDEIHKQAFHRFIKCLKRLLKTLKPSKIKGNLKFGFENPAVTGYTLAGIAVMYPTIRKHAVFEADFENQIMLGDLYIKGHIVLISFLFFALKLVLAKSVRITIKDMLRLRKEMSA